MANDAQIRERIARIIRENLSGVTSTDPDILAAQEDYLMRTAELIAADLCASGQQVRALVDRLQRLDHLCATAERRGPSHDGYVTDATYNHWCGERAAIHDVLSALTPAPQPAGEAVPVAWAYYWPDGGMMNVLLTSDAPHEGLRQVPLYAHPPQPSETVAEAAETVVRLWRRGSYAATNSAVNILDAALRTLKGEA